MTTEKVPCRILVIDDDEDDFFYLKDLLRSLGSKLFELEWAPNFDTGYKLMLEKRHEIYLIDHLLGSGTGLELIQKASEIDAPKILLTGMGNRDLDIIAIRSGADDYLPKSQLTTEILERTIRHALERFAQRSIIEQEQQKFKTLFDHSTDPIFITNSKRKIIDANQSFFQLFGIEAEALEKTQLIDIFCDKKSYQQFESESEGKSYSPQQSFLLCSKDGSKIDALISSTPLTQNDGSETSYQGIIHDITKLKKMENDLQMIEKINLTGRMIRTIAHDIRNPLTNISLASEQLKGEIQNIDPGLEMFTDIINRNSLRINQLISNLLNNTRSTQVELQEHPVEDVIREAVATVQDRIQLKNITVETSGLDCSTCIKIDREKLKTAISNILTNAIEAMEGSKKCVLSISCHNKPDSVVIGLQDSGKGMDAEVLSKLFDPFFTNRPGGMGLGMTAVQQIIQQHNGTIKIESTPGEGSRFEIDLPLLPK